MSLNEKMTQGPVRASECGVEQVHLIVTAAADVEANGYTVTDGGGFVSSVARTAEGKATITLRSNYYKFLGMSFLSTLTASHVLLESEDVDHATVPVVKLIFEISDGTDTDPDSAVMYITLFLQKSSAS